MTSELFGYRTHNAILLSLIVLKNVLVVMTFWACRNLYLKRISEINASLRKPSKPGKCLDTVVSANVMLDDSDEEQITTSRRHDANKVEPVLDGNVLLVDFADVADLEEKHVELKTKELSEADMDSILEDYTARLGMSSSVACRCRLQAQQHELPTPSSATPATSRMTRVMARMTSQSPSKA
jgi:hypothetical protein